MTGRVIHTGQAIVDLVMRVAALPARGGDVFASSHALAAGGGTNVMVAAARRGVPVVYAGGHGEGPFGDIVRQALRAEGITLTAPCIPGIDTGFCVAVVDDGAERTFVSTVGAEGRADLTTYAKASPAERDVVYVSGYSLMHSNNGAVIAGWLPTIASRAVVLDTSPVIAEIPDEILAGVLPQLTHITVNLREGVVLAERLGIAQSGDTGSLAAALHHTTAAVVIVRDGANGCFVASGGSATHVPTIAVTAVDMNGAGDAHTGVLCAALVLGLPLREAVLEANLAGSLSVTRNGPATAPSKSELGAAVADFRAFRHNN